MWFFQTYSGTSFHSAPDALKYILKLHLSVPELQSIQTNILLYFLVNVNCILVSTDKKTTQHNNNPLRKKNFTPVAYKTVCCVKVLLETSCLVRKKNKVQQQ